MSESASSVESPLVLRPQPNLAAYARDLADASLATSNWIAATGSRVRSTTRGPTSLPATPSTTRPPPLA